MQAAGLRRTLRSGRHNHSRRGTASSGARGPPAMPGLGEEVPALAVTHEGETACAAAVNMASPIGADWRRGWRPGKLPAGVQAPPGRRPRIAGAIRPQLVAGARPGSTVVPSGGGRHGDHHHGRSPTVASCSPPPASTVPCGGGRRRPDSHFPGMTGHEGNVWTITCTRAPDGRVTCSPRVAWTAQFVAGTPRRERHWVDRSWRRQSRKGADVLVAAFGSPALAAAGGRRDGRTWDAETGEALGPHCQAMTAVARSPHGRCRTAARFSPRAALTARSGWLDPLTGTEVAVLTGTRGGSVQWTPGGPRRVPPCSPSADDRGTIPALGSGAGKQLSVLHGHVGEVKALAHFSTLDGRQALASAGNDGTVRRWDVDAAVELGPPIAATRAWCGR